MAVLVEEAPFRLRSGHTRSWPCQPADTCRAGLVSLTVGKLLTEFPF